jgi:HEAT repeat protein
MGLAGLLTGLAAVGAAVVACGLALVSWRLGRSIRDRRRIRVADPLRPRLLALVVADEAPTEELEALAALDRRQWAAVEPGLLVLLAKVRGSARRAVVELLRRRGVFEAADGLTRSRRAHKRARGAHRLGLLATPDVGPLLTALLGDRDARVRQVAARAVSASGWAPAARPLLDALVAARPLPPRTVGQALLRLGPPAVPAVVAALDDPRPPIVAAAADVLGRLRAAAAGAALARLLVEGPPEVRVRAARALGRIGAPAAVPSLRAAATSGAGPLRLVAISALADIGDAGACPVLTESLGGEHRIAAAAATALGRLGRQGREALEAAAVGAGPGAVHARSTLATAALAEARSAARTPPPLPPPEPAPDLQVPVVGTAAQ